MKKYISCFALAAILAIMSACGSSQETGQENKVSMSSLKEAMLSADTTLPEMVNVSSDTGQAELNFSYLSDLSYDMVDAYFYSYASGGTAEEIAVVCLKDKNDASAMMESLHTHVEKRQGTFAEYAPDQVALAEKAVVTREGAYIALIVSSKNGLVQKAFQSCFE